MAVPLMVEREVIPGAQAEIKALLRQLRSSATRQPGFISGETVIDAYNPCAFLTVSIWASIAAWESWRVDPERVLVTSRLDDLIQGRRNRGSGRTTATRPRRPSDEAEASGARSPI